MEQTNEAKVVHKPAFRAIGLKWEGTFAEAGAGGIRHIQRELKRRLHEIEHAIQPDTLLGLSYHAYPGGTGFTHYAAIEVGELANVPDGMVEVSVPALAYARCEHRKGQHVERSYQNIYKWIEEQGHALHDGGLTHFETYPMQQDPFEKDPEFTILIPIKAGA